MLANRSASGILEEISALTESKTVLVAYHAADPDIGLSSAIDLEKFKLYLADTGLFVTLMFKDADFTDNIVYQSLLADKLPVNMGSVYENVVAQQLVMQGDGLFYHTWPKYSSGVGNPYVVHTKDLGKDGAVRCVPVCMSQFV